MSQRGFGIVSVGLAILLLFPRESSAGGGDVIWGMSGAQMIGKILHCRVPVGGTITECHIWNRSLDKRAVPPEAPNFWVSLEGGFYISTGKNSDEGDPYRWGDVGMLAFEPLLEFRWPGVPGVRSGVGLGYNFLFGLRKDFDAFDKFNIKVRMIGIESSGYDLAVNLRIYPNGFTSDETGFGTRRDFDRPVEAVIGFSIGFPKVGRWW